MLIDPDVPGSTEQQFAASLPSPSEARRKLLLGHSAATDSGVWRQEIASRIDAFCARRGRKRANRTPSLSLDFERTSGATAAAHYQKADPWEEVQRCEPLAPQAPQEVAAPEPAPPAEPSNIIEFPRVAAPPPPPPSLDLPFIEELAEPIIETPRILEAEEPEEIGLQFGGQPMPSITLEPNPEPAPAEKYLEPASLSRRAFAAVADALIVLTAAGLFGAVFGWMAGAPPQSRAALLCAVVVPALLWAIYEYAFVVYSGATLGMRLAALQLQSFEGELVARRGRRWRVAAMMLSGASLGMGFLWAIIDEDGLCWHDRISRSFLRPQ